jgi:HEAT repeat protein
MQEEDPYIRLRAAWTLGEIRNPEASPILRAALEDRERAVRIHVAWALYRLVQARAGPRG